jgi:hypothetical protein
MLQSNFKKIFLKAILLSPIIYSLIIGYLFFGKDKNIKRGFPLSMQASKPLSNFKAQ